VTTALRFDGVRFGYRGEPLFGDLDLEIGEGEMTGVLGPNGTGKTTLVRLASGFLQAPRGTVLLGGRPVRALPPREPPRYLAVVPQETHLAFRFSAREVVSMGRAAHQGLLGVESATDRERIERAMAQTDVAGLAGRSFQELSGGERQRVVIARAIAQQPRLLLLDEPTAFLDLRHRMAVYEVLNRLNEAGLTLAVVSHDINLVARFCRRVVLLHGGRVVADGPPERALTAESVRRVYGVDADVRVEPLTGRPYVVARGPAGQGSEALPHR